MMRELLAVYLVNAAWQAPVVAVTALLTSRFAGFAPAARHRLWLAFLAAAVVLPALSLQAVLPHATPTIARIAPTAFVAGPPAATAVAKAPALDAALRLPPAVVWAMLALSGLVAAATLVRLAMAGLAARRLVRDAEPADLAPAVRQAMTQLCDQHGRRAPRVLRSPAVASPAVVGVFRPAILIPRGLACEPEALTAALLHETAHVLRHDYAANLACEVFTLPLGWHPALIGLKAGVRKSRELACDAVAAHALGSSQAYAKRLVALARRLGEPARAPRFATTDTALAVGLFGRSDLEDRLMHLLKSREPDAPAVAAARLTGLAAVGAGLLGSAALLHVTPVFAQSPAPPPAPVVAAPLPAPAAAATREAQRDAARPDPAPAAPAAPHHHSRMIFSHNGVVITSGERSYAHSWTARDGRPMTVFNSDPNEPTAEQEQRWEEQSAKAEAKAAKVEAMVNSPEFKAKIAKAEEAGRRAEAMVNSPEFRTRIAAAEEAGRKAEAMVNSPEFRARIAEARASAEDARRMVDSAEFRANIAAAKAAAREARAIARRERDFDDDDGDASGTKVRP